MTRSSCVISDEEFGRQLLTEHLSKQTTPEFKCEVNSDDPPDILVTWNDGVQWGVEVIRTYQRVPSKDGSSTISSAEISEPLWRFAKKLEVETESIRKRDYVLALGPDPGDILAEQPTVFDKAWKRRSEEAIRRHIEDGRTGVLRRPGVKLAPGDPGNHWRAFVNGRVAEIISATFVMLEWTLEKKSKGFRRWNGNFAKRWLLLLNDYPLAEDFGEIERALKILIRSKPDLSGFDGVFWKGRSNRVLKQALLP